MPDIHDVMDVTIEELFPEQQLQLKDAVLNMFRQMMVSIFGPGMEKVLGRVSPQGPSVEIGELSAVVNSQPA
jgi:hypothetical protein